MTRRAVVTGAFSYIGAAVARELTGRGWTVHTLTRRSPPAGLLEITVAPLRFDPQHLRRELEGADAFVTTYWIRLPDGGQTFDTAVEQCRMLFEAALDAGVRRVVHVSVSNPDRGPHLGYYAGKARVEEILRGMPLSWAIVRPTLVVGPNDVLTANIAWLLRHSSVFFVPGGGRCRLQPVTLDDTGRIVADRVEGQASEVVDAAGPEVMTFREYVLRVAVACRCRRWVLGTPGWLALAALRVVEPLLGDVILTREELRGLEDELLLSHHPPLGRESVTDWLMANGDELGRRYVNDRHRHFGAGHTVAILDPRTGRPADLSPE